MEESPKVKLLREKLAQKSGKVAKRMLVSPNDVSMNMLCVADVVKDIKGGGIKHLLTLVVMDEERNGQMTTSNPDKCSPVPHGYLFKANKKRRCTEAELAVHRASNNPLIKRKKYEATGDFVELELNAGYAFNLWTDEPAPSGSYVGIVRVNKFGIDVLPDGSKGFNGNVETKEGYDCSEIHVNGLLQELYEESHANLIQKISHERMVEASETKKMDTTGDVILQELFVNADREITGKSPTILDVEFPEEAKELERKKKQDEVETYGLSINLSVEVPVSVTKSYNKYVEKKPEQLATENALVKELEAQKAAVPESGDEQFIESVKKRNRELDEEIEKARKRQAVEVRDVLQRKKMAVLMNINFFDSQLREVLGVSDPDMFMHMLSWWDELQPVAFIKENPAASFALSPNQNGTGSDMFDFANAYNVDKVFTRLDHLMFGKALKMDAEATAFLLSKRDDKKFVRMYGTDTRKKAVSPVRVSGRQMENLLELSHVELELTMKKPGFEAYLLAEKDDHTELLTAYQEETGAAYKQEIITQEKMESTVVPLIRNTFIRGFTFFIFYRIALKTA